MSTVSKNLTLIIPAYNEAEAIQPFLIDLVAQCSDIVHEILVIDDGSKDNTANLVREVEGVTLIQHKRNQGYGAALKTGVRRATTEFVMTVDSDGQHRIEDVRALHDNVGDNDMLVGARQGLLHSKLWRMPGKWVLGWMVNYLTRRQIPDINSGLRIMRHDVVRRYLHICPSGFSFSTTITMAMFMQGYLVDYHPIIVQERIGTSTVTIKTGFQTLMLIVRIASLFDPLRVFLPTGLWAIFLGIAWGVPFAVAGNGVSVASMLSIMTGILLFGLGILCDQISQLRLERYEAID